MAESDWVRVFSETKGYRSLLQEAYPGIYWVCFTKILRRVFWFGVDKFGEKDSITAEVRTQKGRAVEQYKRVVLFRLVDYPDIVPPDKFWNDPFVREIQGRGQLRLFQK